MGRSVPTPITTDFKVTRVVPHTKRAPPSGTDGFLAYVQRFDIISQLDPVTGKKGPFPDPASGMYGFERVYRADKKTIMGDVIPLDRLRARVELTPQFGKKADSRLTKETSLDYCKKFWLSKWFTKEFFYALDQ
ncbi:hypothetical protein B0H12DRAFT_1077573 [Mycena haematopus]|nr:hypothetical protein B0H12DRAFT_1077573 [Mycena haematopus]